MYSAIWAYPWDFLDEGVDTALGRIQDAGLQGVSVAAAYHHIRALCPHNPKRAVCHGEGGVAYFRPDPEIFRTLRIRPFVSQLCIDRDPLTEVCSAAARRGLCVHAWTVLHHNSRLGEMHPDCVLINAFGDPYPFGLCPAHPDVRAYTVAMVQSLAEREDPGVIELESLGYMGIDHSGHHSKAGITLDPIHRFLLSLCFCDHCARWMEAHGVDVVRAKEDVVREIRDFFAGRFLTSGDDPLRTLGEILGPDQSEGIRAARDEVVLTLLEELFWLVKKPQKLSVMVTGDPIATGAQAPVTLSEARQWTDILLHQTGSRDPKAIHDNVSDVAVRRGSTPVYAGVQAISPFVRNAEELKIAVRVAAEAGAEGVQFYHYGLMPLGNLEWVREALAGV